VSSSVPSRSKITARYGIEAYASDRLNPLNPTIPYPLLGFLLGEPYR
jgi:hypothetical protein